MLQHFVVSGDLLGNGLGLHVVEELLHAPGVAGMERVYLIATHWSAFNRQLGFCDANPQELLLLKR